MTAASQWFRILEKEQQPPTARVGIAVALRNLRVAAAMCDVVVACRIDI
jgi:hypothetical protein